MKKYIKLSVVVLCVAVFATFSSCTKEYQSKHNATLKKLVGTWECVWSATFDVYYDSYFYYNSYTGAPFDELFGLDYDDFSWYTDSHGFVPENYYVGMTWKFDDPVRHYLETFDDCYDVDGVLTVIMNGQTYAGIYSLRFWCVNSDDYERDYCTMMGFYFHYGSKIQEVMSCKGMYFSDNSMAITDGDKIFIFKKIS